MQILKWFVSTVLLLGGCLIVTACATSSKSQNETPSANSKSFVNYNPKRIEAKKQIAFLVRGELGREERTRFQSKSLTKKYEGTQLLHERTEGVDFLVRSKVTKAAAATGPYTFMIETISKDGMVDLHDLAFPELGESLEFIVGANAKVLKAGRYPETSIFFVPPISIPNAPVQVGDTWTLSHSWTSLNNGVALSLELVSIFKNLYECSQGQECAEVEVSGTISVPTSMSKEIQVESKLTGRMLILLRTGSIIWSDVRTSERLKSGNLSVDVVSCLESVLEEPAQDRWLWRQSPQCDPSASLPEKVPGA